MCARSQNGAWKPIFNLSPHRLKTHVGSAVLDLGVIDDRLSFVTRCEWRGIEPELAEATKLYPLSTYSLCSDQYTAKGAC